MPSRNLFLFLRRNGAAAMGSLALAAAAGSLLFQWLRFWLAMRRGSRIRLAGTDSHSLLCRPALAAGSPRQPRRSAFTSWHWLAVILACGLDCFHLGLASRTVSRMAARGVGLVRRGLIGLALCLIRACERGPRWRAILHFRCGLGSSRRCRSGQR